MPLYPVDVSSWNRGGTDVVTNTVIPAAPVVVPTVVTGAAIYGAATDGISGAYNDAKDAAKCLLNDLESFF